MNQNKIYRVLKLIQLLEIKPRSVNGMSRYLGISERSVYRYLNLFENLEYNLKRDIYFKYYIDKNEQRKQTTS
jgi:predicted DNA-binding transcriptional regulator YafY